MLDEKIFKQVASSPELLEQFVKIVNTELSLPNIKMPTIGGEIFWTTLVEYNGIKLQQNDVTKHCRLLDQNNVRIAWGTKNGMIKALDTLYELEMRYKR